jgi:hypothetical protein
MTPDTRPSEKPAPIQFRLRTLLIVVGVLSVVLACGTWYYRTIREPHVRSRQVEATLRSLVNRRPEHVTRGQWGSAVAWTLLLHGNSLVPFEADAGEIRAFQQRLNKKLEGEVDMATIDWIWDEYAELTPHGQQYQRFKEMRDEEMAGVGPNTDVWGMRVP